MLLALALAGSNAVSSGSGPRLGGRSGQDIDNGNIHSFTSATGRDDYIEDGKLCALSSLSIPVWDALLSFHS